MPDKKPTAPAGKPGGRKDAYRQALQRGHSYAWDQKWDQAVAEYTAALAEFPDDAEALVGIGLALFNLKRLPEALTAYQRAARQNPQDTVALEKIADVEERLGHVEEAARVYVAVAEAHLQKRAVQAAIDNWTRACRLSPNLLGAHQRLALVYERLGKLRLAVREYLAIARVFETRGEHEKALQACQKALALDPHNQDVLTGLDLLRAGNREGFEEFLSETPHSPAVALLRTPKPSAEPASGVAPAPGVPFGVPAAPAAPDAVPMEAEPAPLSAESLSELVAEGAVEEQEPEERSSPVESTRQRALADLAASLFAEPAETGQGREILANPQAAARMTRPNKAETDALISQAIDYQTRGNVSAAISKYEQAVAAGVDLPAARFSLGLLYQQTLRFDDAIAQFMFAVRDPAYQLGTHFALGECFRARGRIDEAVAHFLDVLRIVDLAAARSEQADDLTQLYQSLAETLAARGHQDQALVFLNSLVEFLSTQGWEDKVAAARRRLDALSADGLTISLAEVLSIPGSEKLLESLSLAQEYIQRGMLRSAMEETYCSVQLAPTYLPAHLRIAELLQREGRIDEATVKFLTIADVYRVRDDALHAIAVYEQALKLSPMDLAVRTRLIEMLIQRGEIDRALEHYVALADAHYRLAQLDKAREKYREALRLAPRGTASRRWPVQILHRMGDIDMQRLNWREALVVYEQIRKYAPEDERAIVTLIELYYKLNHPQRAIGEVDYLVKMLAAKDKRQKALAILEDLSKSRPNDMDLRARLAQGYLGLGRNADAIEQLDALGELQLDAGLKAEAAATIHAILELNPPDAAGYQRLLAQIGGEGR